MAVKRKKLKVGDRVKISLPGTILELKPDYAYVQIVVRRDGQHIFGEAVCYLDEVRKRKT